MNPNAFIGWAKQPTDEELAAALGPTKPLWDGLIADLATEQEVGIQEWKSYSAKSGWSLRLKRKKRTIVYLSPCSGHFLVTFILGDKAVQAARQSSLSQRIVKMIDEAPRYPEGTGLRIEVRGPKEIPGIRKLAVLKLEN